jgi:Carboxypeptidase regulatory-like domain/TonB dependent receptor
MQRAVACLSFLLVLALSTAFGQTFRGAINGTVTDPTGAVVAGAMVTATDTGTNIAHSMAATSDGQFSFQDLPPGAYAVKVTASGFQTTTISNVIVTAGNVYTVAAQLVVGQQATAVEVAAAAVVIDTTTSTQTDTLPSGTVQDLPLNGRDFTQMIAASPGYGGYSVGGYGSLNGTRANQMNWQIDGTDNNDFWHNIPAVNQGGVSGIAGTVMPIDAVDEFSAQSQSNAETGRSAGGTVNLTLKSGTNQFHGSGYYYDRNEFFAAASPFFAPTPEDPKPPRIRNFNSGFTLGGPLKKEKTFFFIGFERQQYIIGLSGLSTEPSTAWINQAEQLLANPGGKYGSYASVPVSNVSASLFAALYPTNIAGLPATVDNYFASDPSTGYSNNGIVKVDHNFSDKERLSAHFFVGQGSQTAPTGTSLALGTASSNLGQYFEVAPLHVQNYDIVLNSVLTPKFTNQLLAGVSSFYQIFHDADNSFNMKALGLYLSPDATIDGNPIMGSSQIIIGAFDRVGVTPPEGRKDITGHLTDILSYVTGAHQLRFGGEFRQGRVDEFYFRSSTGTFHFDGTQGPWAAFCGSNPTVTGCDSNTTALADFLAGDVSTSSIAVGDAERLVLVNGYDLFGQDNWQVTSKLNLNFGLRYEYFGPLHANNNGPDDLGEFIPGQGLVIPKSLFKPDRNNFAPRFGFAYAPFGGFVVRAGFGVFFDQININPFLDFRPPIGAADGLEDNPIGPHPVDSYSRNNYNWQAVQAGGASVFPGVTTCLGNNTTDPNCQGEVFNVYGINPNLRAAYFFNYNFNVEKSLGGAVVWQVGYVGSQGRKLSIMENINQNGAYDAEYPNFGTILQMNSEGTSNYNSLQTTLKIRTWHGLSGQFAYTWAHALDEVTEYRETIPHDSFDIAADYGSSDFDNRQKFTSFLSYDIPGSSHGPQWLTHGWELSALITAASGAPFNMLTGTDPSGTQRPGLNLIGNPFAGVNHTFNLAIGGEQWINPAAFCVPGAVGCPGTTNPNGDVGRNVFTGPGFADVDLSVFKNFTVRERFRIQLRAEMYNLFNRINLATGAFSVGGNGVVSDTIGDFNGAPGIGPGEPFNLQLVGKVIF